MLDQSPLRMLCHHANWRLTLTQVTHPVTNHTYSFWLSNPRLEKPIKEDGASTADNRLFPWECREMVGNAVVALQPEQQQGHGNDQQPVLRCTFCTLLCVVHRAPRTRAR
jgi:hypothetical protein